MGVASWWIRTSGISGATGGAFGSMAAGGAFLLLALARKLGGLLLANAVLFLLALACGDEKLVGAAFHLLDLLADAVDDIADAFAVLGKVGINRGDLGVSAQAHHI
jgi:hypothetical protein